MTSAEPYDLTIRGEQMPEGEYHAVMLGGQPYVLVQFEADGDGELVANVETGGGVALDTAGEFLGHLADAMGEPEYIEAVNAAAAAAADQETSNDV